uniref:Protein TFG (Trinotate prediction) n=1 Tax=Henneguya salminicola TaxID=69463 RepID=A0A6G3MI22_HENSL
MSLDLQLPVKVYLDDEILLLPLTSDSMTYEGLVDHLQRAFNEKLDPNSQLRIKYLDEDKEWVTITDTAVLIHALKDKTSMKIKVESLKSRPCPTNVANRIALELKPLSESVKNVIDRLTSIANSLEGKSKCFRLKKVRINHPLKQNYQISY